MNSRDEILNRLRKVITEKPAIQIPVWQDKTTFSDYPLNSSELLTEFRKHIENLAGELHVFDSAKDLAAFLPNLLKETNPHRCRSHQSSLIDIIKKLNPQAEQYLTYIDGQEIDSVSFADFAVGITAADLLIARTGSILVRTISAGGRRLSVLPPTHIVIAETDRLVFSLDEALKMLVDQSDPWSYATFITGPSRTSDIEKQLVLGAHGPKRLIILLLKTD
jgi:L-lactate dehydrogenase complex protein LldG